jgi:hypothetical protein
MVHMSYAAILSDSSRSSWAILDLFTFCCHILNCSACCRGFAWAISIMMMMRSLSRWGLGTSSSASASVRFPTYLPMTMAVLFAASRAGGESSDYDPIRLSALHHTLTKIQ